MSANSTDRCVARLRGFHTPSAGTRSTRTAAVWRASFDRAGLRYRDRDRVDPPSTLWGPSPPVARGLEADVRRKKRPMRSTPGGRSRLARVDKNRIGHAVAGRKSPEESSTLGTGLARCRYCGAERSRSISSSSLFMRANSALYGARSEEHTSEL